MTARMSGMASTLVLLPLLVNTGCVGAFTQWGEEISLVSRSATFDPQNLERDKAVVLSAVVGFGLEGYTLQVSRSLSAVLASGRPSIQALSVQATLSELNRNGMAQEYADILTNYKNSGVLSRDFLKKAGETLHVGYVFQPSMAAFSQFTSGRFSFFGLRLFQTRISVLRLSAQLWDTRTGELVWESSGEGTLATEDVREFRIPFESIAERLWRNILADLGLKWEVSDS